MSELEVFLLVIGSYLLINIICLICFIVFQKSAWNTLKTNIEKAGFSVYMCFLGWFYWLKVLIDYIAYIITKNKK